MVVDCCMCWRRESNASAIGSFVALILISLTLFDVKNDYIMFPMFILMIVSIFFMIWSLIDDVDEHDDDDVDNNETTA